MGKRFRYSVICLIGFLLVCAPTIMSAEMDIQRETAKQYQKVVNICKNIKKTIQESGDHRTVVRTAIELGHSACMVVKCAIDGGGKPDEVVAGAIEAGARPDVVTRCATDAGLGEELLAGILASADSSISVCYFGPERRKVQVADIISDPFPPDRGGAGSEGTISEFRF